MRITYRLAFEDYYEASQARSAKSRLVWQCAILAMAFLFSVAGMRQASTRVRDFSIAAVVLASIPALGWLQRLSFKDAHRRAVDAGSEKEFSVDVYEDGIQVVGTANKQEWPYFSTYAELAGAFILYRLNTIEAILPKRAFDLDGVNNFRKLLKANIARH